MSLPSWERGLKLIALPHSALLLSSLPSWERGLKLYDRKYGFVCQWVAPLVGAWIETCEIHGDAQQYFSRSPRGSVD